MKTARDRLGEAEYQKRVQQQKVRIQEAREREAERRAKSFDDMGIYYDTPRCAVYGCDRRAEHEADGDWGLPKNINTGQPHWAYSMICTECNDEFEYMANELQEGQGS